MNKIFVTKSYLPPFVEYVDQLKTIWDNGILTNNGPLAQQLEKELACLHNMKHCLFLSNGTVTLQLLIAALGINGGEIITTPFTYVATISAILWQCCKPIFADIDEYTLCIDPSFIEAKINKNTRAIMPVHIFGNVCDVERIDAIGKKYGIPVIYDAAHSFGTMYKGKSVMSFGNASSCSFHATKLFHTGEGGAVFTQNDELAEIVDIQRRFGHIEDNHMMPGINAKSSEFAAAMGLVNLRHICEISDRRKIACEYYDSKLDGHLQRPAFRDGLEMNYAYYPILAKIENECTAIIQRLNEKNIFPRRYFYPSLNTIKYVEQQKCHISEDVSRRILCLPLSSEITREQQTMICDIILEVI